MAWLARLLHECSRLITHAIHVLMNRTHPRTIGSLGSLKTFRVVRVDLYRVAMAVPEDHQQATWWDGLDEEWDNTPDVRARLRDGHALLLNHPTLQCDGPVERSIHNCRYNKHVLLPALTRWSANGPDMTPSVDHLFVEVEKLYKASKRQATVKEMHNDAWALRKLMGLVKAQVTKTHVPQDSSLNQLDTPLLVSTFF